MIEIEKTTEDILDMKIIDQLHNSTLNFSKTSLEIKKLLFVLISAALPSLIVLANNKLDYSLFITLYVLIITFWFLDGYTYYYQEKLREKMDKHFFNIKKRNIIPSSIRDTKEIGIETGFTLSKERNSKFRIIRSVFNWSSAIYPLLIAMNTLGLILFYFGIIK